MEVTHDEEMVLVSLTPNTLAEQKFAPLPTLPEDAPQEDLDALFEAMWTEENHDREQRYLVGARTQAAFGRLRSKKRHA